MTVLPPLLRYHRILNLRLGQLFLQAVHLFRQIRSPFLSLVKAELALLHLAAVVFDSLHVRINLRLQAADIRLRFSYLVLQLGTHLLVFVDLSLERYQSCLSFRQLYIQLTLITLLLVNSRLEGSDLSLSISKLRTNIFFALLAPINLCLE